MAFSSFQTLSEVLETYGIRYEEMPFIVPTSLAPCETFMKEMQFNLDYLDVFSSEASRAEFLISPILREVYKGYADSFSFWAQKALSADQTLMGIPDYIFGIKSPLGKKVLGSPLVLIVEAKKNDFDQGWGQCLAELVAAQKLNGNTERPIYGIVTDAKVWEFGKLTANIFTQDKSIYDFEEITKLFGAIDFVLKSSL